MTAKQAADKLINEVLEAASKTAKIIHYRLVVGILPHAEPATPGDLEKYIGAVKEELEKMAVGVPQDYAKARITEVLEGIRKTKGVIRSPLQFGVIQDRLRAAGYRLELHTEACDGKCEDR